MRIPQKGVKTDVLNFGTFPERSGGPESSRGMGGPEASGAVGGGGGGVVRFFLGVSGG
jgi:hypothetical protein